MQAQELEPARGVVPELREAFDELGGDDDFWAEQAHSLATFASPGSLQTFRLANWHANGVEVGDRYYVKPLLRAVTFPQAAFVLALAAGSVRLGEILPDGRRSRSTFPIFRRRGECGRKGVDRRPLTERAAPGQRRSEDQAARVREEGDRALRGVLAGIELPVILAATEPLASIYRALNSYPHLVGPAIGGNPQAATDEELAASARSVLDEVYARELAAFRDLFELRFSHERASTDVATVARAATYGAVDTMLVDIDVKVPGYVDDDAGTVAFAEDDGSSYGVVDEIARRTLLTGGRVLAVRGEDVPGGGPVAAILRYPL